MALSSRFSHARRFSVTNLSKHPLKPRTLFLLSLLLTVLLALLFLLSHLFLTLTPLPHISFPPLTSASTTLNTTHLATSPTSWLPFFRAHPHTERLGCREYSTGSQSCVYSGLACINVSTTASTRPVVYFVHDAQPDFDRVPHDGWCAIRNSSTDPRYHASYYFEHLNHTFAPRRACLDAYFRTTESLLGAYPARTLATVNWQPNLWLVDLEAPDNDNNPSLFTDLLWILDVAVWQRTWDIRPSAFSAHMQPLFQTSHRALYLPQSRHQFDITARNVYRLIYAMILQLDLHQLFPTTTAAELAKPPPSADESRAARPLLEAFPRLKDTTVFHADEMARDNVQLVCTPRLSVGAKVYDGAHERVCRNLRQQGYDLFGIKLPPVKHMGRVKYARPPKRVMILQRHENRMIANVDALVEGLNKGVGVHGAEVEVVSTEFLKTAEDWVRTMASAGIVISVHGSQLVGQIWMKRHSALIEIMPVGFTDYQYSALSEACRLWYYEVQSLLPPDADEDEYLQKCGNNAEHMLHPCPSVKSMDVWVNVTQVVKTSRFAFERMGYEMGPWFEFVQNG